MAPLNFSGGGLFEQAGLFDDIGKLSPYYLQEGKDVINIHDSNVDIDTIYTVSSGKVLYVQTMMVVEDDNTNYVGIVLDGITTKTEFRLSAYETKVFYFDPPLKFETDIEFIGSGEIDITMTGWEEDA